MDSMKEIKGWLIQKFQTVTSPNNNFVSAVKGIMPITPQTVPEFVIPGSGDSSRRTSECSESDILQPQKRNSYGGRSHTSSPPGTPVRSSPSEPSLSVHHVQNGGHCCSAPVTPKHESLNRVLSNGSARSTSGLDNITNHTNVDPLSCAAMGLPHFRMQTSYGFSTLSESPHTRRKESLFHLGNESLLTRKAQLKALTRQNSESDSSINTSVRKASSGATMNTGSMPSVVITHTSSRQASADPVSMQGLCNRRLSPTYQAFQGQCHSPSFPSRHNRFYNRRRSSLTGLTMLKVQDSVDGASSGESIGNNVTDSPRHSLGDLIVPPPSPGTVKRHSAPQISAEPLKQADVCSKQRSRSCQHIKQDQDDTNVSHMFAPFGELKFSFQYLAASRQLKVTLIKAENLGGRCKLDQAVSSYAKCCLMPGKIQKQSSPMVKHTKNPVYNHDVYFHNLALAELHSMTLRIKIFTRANNLKLPEFIGEVNILMDGYDILVENRIWKDLESRKDREELGYLEVGVTLDPFEGLLTICVVQAKSLPQHPITGAPDPYVRIDISQPNRSVSKKHTHTKKNTSNPEFNELFTFNISPKEEDLHKTCINFIVFDHDRIRSDDVIGHVVLGSGSQEASQYEHWTDILANSGHPITKWHYLNELEE